MTFIKGFNAIRAFSVALVVLTHLDMSDWIPNTDFVMIRIWPMISGDFGVLTFFVLSGFLISRILLNERDKNGRINLKRFYIRRVLRLFPPLIVFFILVGIAYQFNFMVEAGASIFYALFYLYNYVPKSIYFSEFGHLWSLGVEEQFYIIWPLILSVFKKVLHLKQFIYLIIIVCCVFAVSVSNFSLFQAYYPFRWFIPASCSILIGCLGALYNHYYLSKVKSFIERPFWVAIIIFLGYTYTIYSPSELISLGILFRSIAVLTLLLLIVHSQEKKWVKMLEFKPLAYIGIISYGIYVYQGFFLGTGGGSEVWFQKYPLNSILTIAFAILSYEFIEKPILKLKRKFE